MQDLKELFRQYAERTPDWPQPGMACRDNCGNQWRRVKNAAGFGWIGDVTTFIVRDDEVAEASPDDGHVLSVIEAIANGPDPTDAATMGALLLGMPDAQLCRRTSWNADGSPHPYVWAGPVDKHGNGEIGADYQEAIIRAALAALGEP